MKFIKRTNPSGVVEGIAVAVATVIDMDFSKERTNSNGKPYGFFRADLKGSTITGIAYKATADVYGELVSGEEVTVEATAKDLADGINKNWSLALPTASDVEQADKDAASEFLASL